MQVGRAENGQLVYMYTTYGDEGVSRTAETWFLREDQVLHIPGLGYDGIIGYSPIAMARDAIGMGMAAEEFGSKFFNNGARPSGVLEHPGTLKDPGKLRDAWMAAYGGSNNAGKVGSWKKASNTSRSPSILRKPSSSRRGNISWAR